MKKILLFLLLTTSIVFSQDIPRYIAYQGVLIDKNKQLKPDGDYSFTFKLYDSQNNGNLVWPLVPNVQTLLVTNGIFSTLIGPLDNIEFSKPFYLDITVDGEQFPQRVLLYSSPYALGIADNSVTSNKIKDKSIKENDIADNEIVKSLNNLKDAINIKSGNLNLRININGNDINIESADTVTYAKQLIEGVPSGVPVGTVMAFTGDGTELTSLESQGWYLCDGRSILSLNLTIAEQLKLNKILISGGAWSDPSKLPDLRGYFLRGANAGTLQDPLGTRRDSVSNRLPGNYQQDAFQGHWHNSVDYNWSSGGSQVGVNGGGDTKTSFRNLPTTVVATNAIEELDNSGNSKGNGTPRTTSETRPKNISVNWIIKAK